MRITEEELATFFSAEASLNDEDDESVILTDEQLADAIAEARARSGPAAGRVDGQDRLRDRLANLVAESGAT